MKGGNTFWIIWGGVLVLWLVLRYFAKQRMHPVPGMETETYKNLKVLQQAHVRLISAE